MEEGGEKRTDREIDFIFSLTLSSRENQHNIRDADVCVRNNNMLQICWKFC